MGVPVVGTSARENKGIDKIKEKIFEMSNFSANELCIPVSYPDEVEKDIEFLSPYIEAVYGDRINSRWIALRFINRDYELCTHSADIVNCTVAESIAFSVSVRHSKNNIRTLQSKV